MTRDEKQTSICTYQQRLSCEPKGYEPKFRSCEPLHEPRLTSTTSNLALGQRRFAGAMLWITMRGWAIGEHAGMLRKACQRHPMTALAGL